MGAENSILEGCQWDDPIESPPTFSWQLSPVTNSDGTEATVFEPKSSEGKDGQLLKKCAAILRALRHPNIVRFIGCSESTSHVWLATESVIPLVSSVNELSSEELCVGLHDILQGLDFLHSRLGMSHNNLSLSSIFVSSDGTWKLCGFEHACKFSDATQEFLEKIRAYRKEDTLSPEEKSGTVSIDGSLNHARDVFAFGCLVDAALDLVKEKDERLKLLEHQMSSCCSPDPSGRPKVSVLLKMSAFSSSDLIDILCFLKHVTVKSESEKKEFFSTLLPRLQRLPEEVLAKRLVVPLLARFVLLNEYAEKLVLPNLLVPKGSKKGESSSIQGLLSEPLYKTYVIKHLFNIFHVHDSHIRLILLEHFSAFAHLFAREQLEDDIFIQILLGIRDTNDRMVAASLRALADLVPLLGGDYVIGGKRKPFFFHGLPKKITPQDMLKMDIPRNMNSALSHKPLLKDLAMAKKVSGADNNLLEKERKARERELRREEAKLKREERRKQLKVSAENKEESPKERSGVSGLTIEQAADLDLQESESPRSPAKDYIPEDQNHVAKDPSDISENGVDNEEEEESPDWSDWEDADKRISDEIEVELETMSPVVTSKLQTSPSPNKSRPAPSPPPLKVDWSDGPKTDQTSPPKKMNGIKSSRMNLTSKTKKEDIKVVQNESNDNLEDWGTEKWEERDKVALSLESSVPKPQSLTRDKSSLSKPPSMKSQPKRSPDDLGLGLDIKSIEIVPKSLPRELDFFADMAPTISLSKQKVLLDDLESSSQAEVLSKVTEGSLLDSSLGKQDALPKKGNAIFAVIANQGEDTGGWGEADTDWGNEDF